MTPEELRDGIFALFTRRFGTVAELMIERMEGFTAAREQLHDLFDDRQNRRVEVKFLRALNPHDGSITAANILETIEASRAARKAVALSDAERDS